ncbi:MAG: hypothetical protein D3909_12625, partial [Candidatus Electrothrix sp. ATG1]|nr:hypothetical protein [Candidatus Electrothrix sp. ATG1]
SFSEQTLTGEQDKHNSALNKNSCGCGCSGQSEKVLGKEGIKEDADVQRSFLRDFLKNFPGKLKAGIRYAIFDIWEELAVWFIVGILLAGIITVLLPDEFISAYLGGGLSSMLLMLVIGIPLYICATASTPIAAAFLLKGVSPGTALVFLLVGPATNITSLSVLVGLLGKRAVALYLTSIAVVSVLCGLILDAVYSMLGISVIAAVAKHGKMLPEQLTVTASIVLLIFSIRPLKNSLQRRFGGKEEGCCSTETSSCACHHDSHETSHETTLQQGLPDLRKEE